VEDVVQEITTELIGKYGWMALAFFTLSIFRNTITEMIEALGIFIGNDFNNDDVIYVNGREARIIRVTLRKTVFYMVEENTKMVVKNTRLKSLTLEKKLPNTEYRQKYIEMRNKHKKDNI